MDTLFFLVGMLVTSEMIRFGSIQQEEISTKQYQPPLALCSEKEGFFSVDSSCKRESAFHFLFCRLTINEDHVMAIQLFQGKLNDEAKI